MNLEFAIQWAFAEPGRIQQNESELRMFLAKVASELKPERTVELGSWIGTTAALLSWVTSRITVSLDIEEYGGKEQALAIAPNRNLRFHLANAMSKATVISTLSEIGGRSIDLLFVDDGHRTEEVTKEFEIWKGAVRPGGWIVFHDINPDANQCAPGVHPEICMAHEFWAKIEGNKEEIVFGGHPPGPGIGILRV